jgi:hypothetical protein
LYCKVFDERLKAATLGEQRLAVATRRRWHPQVDCCLLVCGLDEPEGHAVAVTGYETIRVVVELIGAHVGVPAEQRLPQLGPQPRGVRGHIERLAGALEANLQAVVGELAGPAQPIRE